MNLRLKNLKFGSSSSDHDRTIVISNIIFLLKLQKVVNTPQLLCLEDPSSIISKTVFEDVWNWLPDRFLHLTPRKVFSTEKDGCSLNYLYSMCEEYTNSSMIFFVKTDEKSV